MFVGLSYYTSIKNSKEQTIGITGELVALLVFILGFLSFTNHLLISIAIAIIITTFLYLKQWLHRFLKVVSEEEVYSTLVFGILAFVILPFLPNQTYGPFNVLNPYKIWLMIVLISGLSFVGYILVKVFDAKKGIGLTGLFGGLVSSTATTITFASKSKEEKNEQIIKLLVFGTLIANAVMIARVLVEVFVINKTLMHELLFPLIVMFIVTLLCVWYMWHIRGKIVETKKTEVNHKSPLNIKTAIKFGLFFGIMLLIIKLAQNYLGQTGIYIASIISGFVDVDAITLSVANIAGSDITIKVAATAITLGVMSNILVKVGYASLFGSKEFRKQLGLMMGIIILSGILAIWVF